MRKETPQMRPMLAKMTDSLAISGAAR